MPDPTVVGSSDIFTFLPPPRVLSVEPSVIMHGEPAVLTVKGHGFGKSRWDVSDVRVGSEVCVVLSWTSGSRFTCRTPAKMAGGDHIIKVTMMGGISSTDSVALTVDHSTKVMLSEFDGNDALCSQDIRTPCATLSVALNTAFRVHASAAQDDVGVDGIEGEGGTLSVLIKPGLYGVANLTMPESAVQAGVKLISEQGSAKTFLRCSPTQPCVFGDSRAPSLVEGLSFELHPYRTSTALVLRNLRYKVTFKDCVFTSIFSTGAAAPLPTRRSVDSGDPAELAEGQIFDIPSAFAIDNCSDVEFINCTFISLKGSTTTSAANSSSSMSSTPSSSVIVSSNSTVSVTDSLLFNNSANVGGAMLIREQSTLRVVRTIFRNNEAVRGGAVLVSRSTAEIADSLFEDQVSAEAGGAIYLSRSRVSVSNTTFDRNRVYPGHGDVADAFPHVYTSSSNGSVAEPVYVGGAIHATMSELRLSSNSSFNENGVNISLVRSEPVNGTPVSKGGGAISLWSSELKSTDSTFSGNFAQLGGAIVLKTLSEVNIQGGVFESNAALVAGSPTAVASEQTEGAGLGGAIYCQECARLTLSGGVFRDNAATAQGGAIHIVSLTSGGITNTLFSNNVAGLHGGAVSVVVQKPPDVAPSNNIPTDWLPGSAGTAPAVVSWTSDTSSVAPSASLSGVVLNMKDCTFEKNIAVMGGGGGLYLTPSHVVKESPNVNPLMSIEEESQAGLVTKTGSISSTTTTTTFSVGLEQLSTHTHVNSCRWGQGPLANQATYGPAHATSAVNMRMLNWTGVAAIDFSGSGSDSDSGSGTTSFLSAEFGLPFRAPVHLEILDAFMQRVQTRDSSSFSLSPQAPVQLLGDLPDRKATHVRAVSEYLFVGTSVRRFNSSGVVSFPGLGSLAPPSSNFSLAFEALLPTHARLFSPSTLVVVLPCKANEYKGADRCLPCPPGVDCLIEASHQQSGQSGQLLLSPPPSSAAVVWGSISTVIVAAGLVAAAATSFLLFHFSRKHLTSAFTYLPVLTQIQLLGVVLCLMACIDYPASSGACLLRAWIADAGVLLLLSCLLMKGSYCLMHPAGAQPTALASAATPVKKQGMSDPSMISPVVAYRKSKVSEVARKAYQDKEEVTIAIRYNDEDGDENKAAGRDLANEVKGKGMEMQSVDFEGASPQLLSPDTLRRIREFCLPLVVPIVLYDTLVLSVFTDIASTSVTGPGQPVAVCVDAVSPVLLWLLAASKAALLAACGRVLLRLRKDCSQGVRTEHNEGSTIARAVMLMCILLPLLLLTSSIMHSVGTVDPEVAESVFEGSMLLLSLLYLVSIFGPRYTSVFGASASLPPPRPKEDAVELCLPNEYKPKTPNTKCGDGGQESDDASSGRGNGDSSSFSRQTQSSKSSEPESPFRGMQPFQPQPLARTPRADRESKEPEQEPEAEIIARALRTNVFVPTPDVENGGGGLRRNSGSMAVAKRTSSQVHSKRNSDSSASFTRPAPRVARKGGEPSVGAQASSRPPRSRTQEQERQRERESEKERQRGMDRDRDRKEREAKLLRIEREERLRREEREEMEREKLRESKDSLRLSGTLKAADAFMRYCQGFIPRVAHYHAPVLATMPSISQPFCTPTHTLLHTTH